MYSGTCTVTSVFDCILALLLPEDEALLDFTDTTEAVSPSAGESGILASSPRDVDLVSGLLKLLSNDRFLFRCLSPRRMTSPPSDLDVSGDTNADSDLCLLAACLVSVWVAFLMALTLSLSLFADLDLPLLSLAPPLCHMTYKQYLCLVILYNNSKFKRM